MMKNPERARAILEEALVLEPDNRKARGARDRLPSGGQ